jgi:hypothetical protein
MVVVFGPYFAKNKNQGLLRFVVSVRFFVFVLIDLSGFIEVC